MRFVKLHAGGLKKKQFSSYHKDIKKSIKHMNKITKLQASIVGTSSYQGVSYYGDVDLISLLTPDKIPQLAKQIQKIVKKLPKDVEFSDLKAGATKSGTGYHWSKKQVIAGRRGKLRLSDALGQNAITKLDILIPIRTGRMTRYCEMTNFYFIPGISRPFGDFTEEMDKDIVKYKKLNRHLKVLKRKLSKLLWADKKEDQKQIRNIVKVITGEAGRKSALLADCETLRLLKDPKHIEKQLDWIGRNTSREKITKKNIPKIEKELMKEINKLVKNGN